MRAIDFLDLQHGAMRVRLLSYGAVTQGWWYDGVPLILGYDDPEAYITDPFYVGAIVGPVANRISGARYAQDEREVQLSANEGVNTLHCGPEGLSAQHWKISRVDEQRADLTYTAISGEAGFPGQASFRIRVTLSDNKLTYDMRADVDCPRPISLAQHNYYTLGQQSGSDLSLTMPMEQVLTLSDCGIATGEVEGVGDADLDFRNKKPLRDIPDGLDRFFIRSDKTRNLQHMAELAAPSGLKLRVASDQAGAQIYTGHGLGAPFDPWGGICIEPSGYPNAVNQPQFPSMFCTPSSPYAQKLVLEVRT